MKSTAVPALPGKTSGKGNVIYSINRHYCKTLFCTPESGLELGPFFIKTRLVQNYLLWEKKFDLQFWMTKYKEQNWSIRSLKKYQIVIENFATKSCLCLSKWQCMPKLLRLKLIFEKSVLLNRKRHFNCLILIICLWMWSATIYKSQCIKWV